MNDKITLTKIQGDSFISARSNMCMNISRKNKSKSYFSKPHFGYSDHCIGQNMPPHFK